MGIRKALSYKCKIGTKYMHCVSKTFGESYQKTNTKDTNNFTWLPFKIVTIRYNTLDNIRTASEKKNQQRPHVESIAERRHTIFDGIHVAKRETLIAAFKRGNRKKSTGARSEKWGGWLSTVLSSEPGIGARGSHYVQGLLVEQHPFSSPVKLWLNPPIRCSKLFKTTS